MKTFKRYVPTQHKKYIRFNNQPTKRDNTSKIWQSKAYNKYLKEVERGVTPARANQIIKRVESLRYIMQTDKQRLTDYILRKEIRAKKVEARRIKKLKRKNR